MNAAVVASSGQMFSPFGQAPRSSSPAVNPFAPQPAGGSGPFGLDGAGDANRAKNKRKGPLPDGGGETKKLPNPFQTLSAGGGDGGGKKKRGADGDRPTTKKTNAFQKSSQQHVRQNGFRPDSEDDRPTSSSSASSIDLEPSPAFNANDPHARKVYERLRADGISPPQWPSQPGNPKNKAPMNKFREQYESYRDRVRVSLTKAGLIDDPDKRKALRDAIHFKGICEDMCPEFEKITRITEADVYQPEKDAASGFANTSRMIKKLARSAAGQEAPLPMDVRSVPALRRTLDYLIDRVLRTDGNLPTVHGFLWDRTRAIRRDFSFFSVMTPDELKTQVYILENIARFHVTALHLLTEEGKSAEDFVEQQELEQLGKSLLSLRDLYDDCNGQGITCDNEAEFRAYYLIFHGYDSNIMEVLQRQWKPALWRDSDEIRTAVSLVEALQNTQDFHGPLDPAPSLAASAAHQSYFRIVNDPKVSYTMACFAECHFPQIRRSILRTVKRALARPKESTKDVTAEVLNKFLRFDTVQQAIDFAELHDFEFLPDEQYPNDVSRQYLVLANRNALPHPRLGHQFSATMVERKRGSRPLPDVIHQTVFEDASSAVGNKSTEASMFVSDTPNPIQPPAPAKPSAFTPSTATPFGQPKPPQAVNPFAPAAPPSGSATANPFAQPGPTIPAPVSATPQFSAQPSFIQPAAKPEQPPQPAQAPAEPGKSPFTASASPFSSLPKPTPSISGLGHPAQPQPALASTPQLSLSPFGSAPAFGAPSTAPSQPKPQSVFTSTPAFTPAPAFAPTPKPVPSPTPQVLPPTPALPTTTTPQPGNAFKPISNPINATNGPPVKLELAKQPLGPFAPPASAKTSEPVKPFAPLKPSEPTKPLPPPKPPAPPRDLLGDFTKWFVQGDNGLWAEFQIYMLENIVRDVFDSYEKAEGEKKRLKEEEQDKERATKFRVYNLSLRYFYRWKENARQKRLKALRRSGRDQMRAFHQAQQAAHARSQKEASERKAKEKAQIALLNRPDEFLGMLRHQSVNKRHAERDLLASGVLSGLSNEREAAATIVHDMAPPPRAAAMSHRMSRSRSGSVSKGGAKTQALREELMGGSSRFRRSLPPMSTDGSTDSAGHVSGVSERWRLKAMGIVQLPDGTAVPESLAREMSRSRRSSVNAPRPSTSVESQKRKRTDSEGPNTHKRVMSDAEKLIGELRAMRAEMEEGTSWFRSQSDRLQSEISSRGGTPFDERSM